MLILFVKLWSCYFFIHNFALYLRLSILLLDIGAFRCRDGQ